MAGKEGGRKNTPKGIAEIAVPARAGLAFHRKVDLGQIVGGELDAGGSLLLGGRQRLVGGGPLVRVLLLDLLLQAAGAVLARSAAFASLRPTLRR